MYRNQVSYWRKMWSVWLLCLLAAQVFAHSSSGASETNAEVSAEGESRMHAQRPVILGPLYPPIPVGDARCTREGDMFYSSTFFGCNVCGCFTDIDGSLYAKCSPCNKCPEPSVSSSPHVWPPQPHHIPPMFPPSDYIPSLSPYITPIPVPRPEICPPPIVIPGSLRPYPVPVPGKRVIVPAPMPSPSSTVYIPGLSAPVPVPEKVPYSVLYNTRYPVPSTKIFRVPVPNLSVPVPVPSPLITIPFPMNRYITIPGKGRIIAVPVPFRNPKYHSIPVIIYVSPRCKGMRPLTPFRIPGVPCHIHVCKVKYNYVYLESFPDPACNVPRITPVGLYPGLNTITVGRFSSTDAQAGVQDEGSWGFNDQAQASTTKEYYSLRDGDPRRFDAFGNYGSSSHTQVKAKALAHSQGYGGWGGNTADAQAQASAQASGQQVGGSGDIGGWEVRTADTQAHAQAQQGGKFGGIGGWGGSIADTQAQAITQAQAQQDGGFGGIGGWEGSTADIQAQALAHAQVQDAIGSWGGTTADAQAQALAHSQTQHSGQFGGLGGWGSSTTDTQAQVLAKAEAQQRGRFDNIGDWGGNTGNAQAFAQGISSTGSLEGWGGTAQANSGAAFNGAGAIGWEGSADAHAAAHAMSQINSYPTGLISGFSRTGSEVSNTTDQAVQSGADNVN